MNYKNIEPHTLDKIPEPERKEIARKGGLSHRGMFKLIKSRRCSAKCPMFGFCIFQPLSKLKFGGKCALANLESIDIAAKHRFVKFTTGGREEFSMLMRSIIAEIFIMSEKDRKLSTMFRLMEILIKFYKSVFGEKQEIAISNSNGTALNWGQLRMIYESEKNGSHEK